ncbi:Regulating synaptic membrane exocytosis protein [Apis cerana cerana]|uniref:Regulating synaptic membrane exocytosis protein n=1 Tax=Apis cerana cerana TaxID=94128 RepID=A0A2A3EJ65_APICC|nr:Regulating synaptic membrane exocytosis protein [Apis cerana cerana]
MADDLCAREDTGYGTLPEAYAKLALVPIGADQITLKTVVAEPSQKPIWNATLLFSGVDGESLMKRAIEVTLWDFCPDGDNVFLGECTVDLERALENDRAVWLLRKTELRERSYSDDTQSDSGSPELCFLHPDHAWHANSRRGSSQSEQLEVEPYELNRDYSRSLPGSRRSSFQSQGGTDSKRGSMGETEMPTIHFNRDRRRSSFTRPMRDPEEILEGLRSLKAAKRELGRTMSLSGDKRRESRGQSGEVKLGLCLSKGTLEVEVICARDICPGEKEEPDTYVKTYLRDGDRWLQKRKTRVVRHSRNPQYRQTIKYSSCDALGRNLLVMLWEKKQAFESNQGLGGAEVSLDLLPLAQLTVDWYPLFPIHTLGTHTADSP